MTFTAGRVIDRREVLHGQLWMSHPVTVVSDDGVCLAVLLEPGSPFTFAAHPFGPHPWSVADAWADTRVLQLHRENDPYSVWKIFDAGGELLRWYINFEAPIVRPEDGRGGGSFDTDDHGIDIVIPVDGSPWQWKDVDDPARHVATGRTTQAEADQIMSDAAAVAADLDSGRRWWTEWDSWSPSEAGR
ncbi:MAG: hypothetical protein QOE05_3068 [Actinomycetota bacterium]|nr:hypothetical protein [Actinomycetota bacterium]